MAKTKKAAKSNAEKANIKDAGISNGGNPVQACAEEINSILAKYELQFDVSILLKAGQVIPNVNLVPIKKPEPESNPIL